MSAEGITYTYGWLAREGLDHTRIASVRALMVDLIDIANPGDLEPIEANEAAQEIVDLVLPSLEVSMACHPSSQSRSILRLVKGD